MTTLVTYTLDKSVATIAMDDGKMNALSPQMFAELNAAVDRAQADKAAIILTGRQGAFSAGFDLKVLMAGGATAVDLLISGFRFSERLLTYPKPVVIAVSGHAIAMGVFVVLSGDYRVGVDGSFKVIANEVAIGLTMPHAAVEICRQRLTPSHFNRAVNLSELYSPEDSIDAGFLDKVVSEADLQAEAQAAMARLLKLNLPAHAATKERSRAQALAAIRAGIEADEKEFRARFNVK